MVVGIELLAVGLNLLESVLCEYILELMHDELESLDAGISIHALLHVLQCAVHIVHYGQFGHHEFLGSTLDEFGFLLDGALAVVVKLGSLAQVFVF